MAHLYLKTSRVSKEVAHTIPGALDKLKITPELRARLTKVAANCDAEIIR